MNNPVTKNYFAAFKEQAHRLLANAKYQHAIPAERQKQEIEKLAGSMQMERFFFVINNETFELEEVHNVEKILGYNLNTFSLHKYIGIIHPSHKVAQMNYAYPLMEELIRGDWPLNLGSHYFIGNVGLKHANGEWLLFKRVSYPYQVSDKNHLLAYICEFTLINKFSNEPYISRFTDASGTIIDIQKKNSAVEKTAKKQVNPFSKQEFKLLQITAKHPGLTTKAMAEEMDIGENSIKTYRKRIKEKAEAIYQIKFNNTKHVALYLKEVGLV